MNGYLHRRMNEARATMLQAQAERRRHMIEEYSVWHDRSWLESMNYPELVAAKNAGHLDRPPLPLGAERRRNAHL